MHTTQRLSFKGQVEEEEGKRIQGKIVLNLCFL